MTAEGHSVTRWIDRLHSDPQAARVLWERFLARMLAVARQRLGSACRRVSDEEDVVVQAFTAFLQGAQAGRFPRLEDRDDLWAVLFTLTARQADRQVRDQRRDKRGAGKVRGDSALRDGDGGSLPLPDDEPTPAEALLLQDGLARLLEALGDGQLRQIALACLEGYSNAEIARQVGRSIATVERRRQLIRQTWQALALAEENTEP